MESITNAYPFINNLEKILESSPLVSQVRTIGEH
jgi:hypothetical protein